MTADAIKNMMARDLAFAVSRTGVDLTIGEPPVTANAIISGSTDGRRADDIGDMPTLNIGATLPVASFPRKPQEGDLFKVVGRTYRVQTVMTSFNGHAWSITGTHESE